MLDKLAIYGAGGHGKVVADTAELLGWKTIHFFDERYLDAKKHGPWSVVGNFAQLCKEAKNYNGVIVAIGNNLVRLEKQRLLRDAGASIVSIIHPSAVVSSYASVGSGTVIFAGAVINAFASFGEAVIINTQASVDHDCIFANGVHICPGTHIAGNVTIGEASWVWIGSSIIQQLSITDHVYIGAGSVVVKDIEESGTYFGVPAKLIKS